MLTREMRGLALLGISWVTGFMIALDASIDLRSMLALLRSWKTTLKAGTVKTDELAVHEVEQRVKELDSDSPGLVFFDRKHTSTVTGGLGLVPSSALNSNESWPLKSGSGAYVQDPSGSTWATP